MKSKWKYQTQAEQWPPPQKKKKVWKNLGGGSKKWKNFFAFLDELGHSEYFLKSMENGSDPPSPAQKSMENSILFIFFYFEGFPKLQAEPVSFRLGWCPRVV